MRELWIRFWALPWSRKGPPLVAAALVAVGAGIAAAVLASGSGDDEPPATAPTQTDTRASSRTMATPTPSATQPPAATPRAEAYRLVSAVPSATYDKMLGFFMFPDSNDEAVVIQQTGEIWRVSVSDAFAPELMADLSGRLIANPGLEEGLLGFAFAPDFQSDGRVYVYYSAGDPRRSVLSRFAMRGGVMDTASELIIMEVPQPFENHNGGQLAFGPDGMLYVALGDGGAGGDPQGNGQDLGGLLGSILRIDVSGDGYVVPPDNPFVGQAGAAGEIWAYGLRNPWRFSFDRDTGDLWAGDVGQNEWEEVDLVVRGGNYGWNIMEAFECYGAAQCNQSGLQAPRAAYGHADGCSVTGGYVYRGAALPELAGWYVYGDFCSGNIWAVNTADTSDPVLLARSGQPVASFGELPDGEIVVVTFANRIFRLTRQ
ncbi:MAG: PQQ-dependent sugar dehydrogenase [Dehalococcoidia bacterium]